MHDIQERLNGSSLSSLSAAAAAATTMGSSKKALKHSPLPHSFTNSSAQNLVTVMMDEKAHDTEDHSFYMPLRRGENGHNSAEYDEGIKSYIHFFFFLLTFRKRKNESEIKKNTENTTCAYF